ncbi:MAG: hypothetical protein WAM60_13265 [Candidatus Promineifilaceae bacterium]
MNLLFITHTFGGRVAFHPLYMGTTFFFQGKPPAPDSVILVEMPGLTGLTLELFQKWFQEHLDINSRRDLVELPESMWRMATLDDFLIADNYQWLTWQMSKYFDLEAFQAFGHQHLAQAQRQLDAVVAISDSTEQVKKLKEIRPFLERVFSLMNQAPARIGVDYDKAMKAIEETQLETLSTFSTTIWIETADALYTSELSRRLLNEVAASLKRPGVPQEHIHDVLQRIAQRPKLRQLSNYAPGFWQQLLNVLRYDGNVTEETIDIAPAQEQTVRPGWELFESRRVGRIIPGRAALVLREDNGRITYIGADRKLKFKVSQAGGSLNMMGNTLVLGDSGQARLHQALLEVEQLNALANVDPAEAVRRVEHLRLSPDHSVYQAAHSAQSDPRYSRILADLLIELVVGIDADVARRLMRSQSRSRRR